MVVAEHDLWALTSGRPQIDPDALAAAVERQVLVDGLDFRTRLLVRDAAEALAARWGLERFAQWLARSPARDRIAAIRREDLGPVGFPSLGRRLMEQTKPESVLQFLRELGSHTRRPARVFVGGSASLILVGMLSRHTEDVDVVNEVPPELREQHDLLDRLAGRYGLHLAHFQSQDLPDGWEGRARSLGRFGALDVHLVDPVDVFISKLFSVREKDRDDLRVMAPALVQSDLAARLHRDAGSLRSEPKLADAAAANWYILYGEPLPS